MFDDVIPPLVLLEMEDFDSERPRLEEEDVASALFRFRLAMALS